jgi:hypothetical protein
MTTMMTCSRNFMELWELQIGDLLLIKNVLCLPETPCLKFPKFQRSSKLAKMRGLVADMARASNRLTQNGPILWNFVTIRTIYIGVSVFFFSLRAPVSCRVMELWNFKNRCKGA